MSEAPNQPPSKKPSRSITIDSENERRANALATTQRSSLAVVVAAAFGQLWRAEARAMVTIFALDAARLVSDQKTTAYLTVTDGRVLLESHEDRSGEFETVWDFSTGPWTASGHQWSIAFEPLKADANTSVLVLRELSTAHVEDVRAYIVPDPWKLRIENLPEQVVVFDGAGRIWDDVPEPRRAPVNAQRLSHWATLTGLPAVLPYRIPDSSEDRSASDSPTAADTTNSEATDA